MVNSFEYRIIFGGYFNYHLYYIYTLFAYWCWDRSPNVPLFTTHMIVVHQVDTILHFHPFTVIGTNATTKTSRFWENMSFKISRCSEAYVSELQEGFSQVWVIVVETFTYSWQYKSRFSRIPRHSLQNFKKILNNCFFDIEMSSSIYLQILFCIGQVKTCLLVLLVWYLFRLWSRIMEVNLLTDSLFID